MSFTLFQMRCRPEQRRAWEAAAGHMPLARWVRQVLDRAAGSEGLGGLTEPRDDERTHRAIRALAMEESKPVPSWARPPE